MSSRVADTRRNSQQCYKIAYRNPVKLCGLREPFLCCRNLYDSPCLFLQRGLPPVYFVVCCFAGFESPHWLFCIKGVMLVKGSSASLNFTSYAFEVHGLHAEIYDFNYEFSSRGGAL